MAKVTIPYIPGSWPHQMYIIFASWGQDVRTPVIPAGDRSQSRRLDGGKRGVLGILGRAISNDEFWGAHFRLKITTGEIFVEEGDSEESILNKTLWWKCFSIYKIRDSTEVTSKCTLILGSEVTTRWGQDPGLYGICKHAPLTARHELALALQREHT